MRIGRICATLFLLWLTSEAFPVLGQAIGTDVPDCSLRSTSSERLRCVEEFSQRTKAVNRTSELAGGWRLVRTANPRGGPDAVSVMHISDSAKSDLALAGLTLRCSDSGGVEALLILLEPIDRKSHATAAITVTVTSDTAPTVFEASVVQGGEAVLLRKPAPEEALKSWQKASDLGIEIASNTPISGHIPVAGMSDALQRLSQACAAR
jgi:hypothetical protein